jgi:hypothetical protein
MATDTTAIASPTSVITSTVDRYFAMWNETDAGRRDELIELAWTDSGRYVDPLLEAQGHEALAEMVAAVQAQFPGHRFARVSEIDAHHDVLRFAWELVGPDGTVAAGGVDCCVVASDGRLDSVTGFLGELKPLASS